MNEDKILEVHAAIYDEMAEKEYIEREKAFDAVFGQFCASSDETEAALNAAIEEIRAIPAADVRPVVLCKDCMYAPSGTDGGEVRGFALEWPHDEWPEDNPCPCKMVLLEEMSELQKEICKHWRGRDNTRAIAEEIADVEIMLEQMKMIFQCADAVSLYRIQKLKRLERRLSE